MKNEMAITNEKKAAAAINDDQLCSSVAWEDIFVIAGRRDADPHGVVAELIDLNWKLRKDRWGSYYKRAN